MPRHLLRLVDVPQGDVVEAGELPQFHPLQVAHGHLRILSGHTAEDASPGIKMPHGQNGDLASMPPLFRQRKKPPVVLRHPTGKPIRLLFRGILGSTAPPPHVRRPEIGGGTDNGLLLPRLVLQGKHLLPQVFRVYLGDDTDPVPLQESLGGVQEGGTVVVSRNDHNLPATRLLKAGQEIVVEPSGFIGGGTIVEDVPREEGGLEGPPRRLLHQMAKDPLQFLVAAMPLQGRPQVNVTHMQNLHRLLLASRKDKKASAPYDALSAVHAQDDKDAAASNPEGRQAPPAAHREPRGQAHAAHRPAREVIHVAGE